MAHSCGHTNSASPENNNTRKWWPAQKKYKQTDLTRVECCPSEWTTLTYVNASSTISSPKLFNRNKQTILFRTRYCFFFFFTFSLLQSSRTSNFLTFCSTFFQQFIKLSR